MVEFNMDNMLQMLTPMLLMQSQKSSSIWESLRNIAVILLVHLLGNASTYTTKLVEWWKSSSTRKASYTVGAKITFKYNMHYSSECPPEYHAIMRHLRAFLMTNKSSYHFTVEQVQLTYSKFMDAILFDDPSKPVFVSDDIQIRHTHVVTKSDKDDYTFHTYTFHVSSTSCSYIDIKTCVDEWVSDYNREEMMTVKPPHIFVFTSVCKETMKCLYHEIPFDTTKSFDNMFFDGKDKLLQKLEDFSNNEARYKRLGIPYTFGMLFHGQPGCGKTSCIKAIAKHTGRHIVSISCNKITSIEALKRIFIAARMNDSQVPLSKRLYVFEEIDCGEWKDIVRSRKLKDSHSEGADASASKVSSEVVMAECMKLAMTKACSVENKSLYTMDESKLTLGDLLELLDGIIEMPGRMIIMTSNHPENIDEALLRPGRIDQIIEFKKMTRHDISSMYNLWFNKNLPHYVQERIKDYTLSQAEIGNLFTTMDLPHIHEVLANI
jgi:hypothetical protein